MIEDKRRAREARIAEAAYALMAEKGFAGLTISALARRAKASNETLYNWYGDKTGLFRMLIQRNAARVTEALPQDAAPDLHDLGAVLLEMLLSPEAIALNRAAAADSSDQLGQTLAEGGRGQVVPRLQQAFARLAAEDRLTLPVPEALGLWLDLLVGDWQIRCATGAARAPDPAARSARAARAANAVLRQSAPDF